MLKKLDFKTGIQIISVLFLLFLPLLMVSEQNVHHFLSGTGLKKYLIFCFIFASIYFLHSWYLFPKFYNKSNLLYLLSMASILAFILWLRPFDKFVIARKDFVESNRPQLPPDYNHPERNIKFPLQSEIPDADPRIDIVSIFLFFLIIIISITKETNNQLQKTRQQKLIAEAEKVQAELSFLKAQLNPHFLFNTLNNIYTLAIIKAENTAPLIMKLSNIMRYITDEACNEFVYLKKEISCINDFIDLQKLRLTQKTELIFETGGNFENKEISPLLLMAFIENVFKYGISNNKRNKLIIKILSNPHSLDFFCQNTIYPDKINAERSGIGLTNTIKRLQYLYKDKHLLTIDDKNELFTIKLTIQL